MRRKEALIAVVGGMLGAILTMVVGSFSPLGAQSQSDVSFGKITCKELVVENPDGMDAVWIFPGTRGGVVAVYGKDGKTMVELSVNEKGGQVTVFPSPPYTARSKDKLVGAYASIDVAEHGGRVRVIGKDEKSLAIMNINEDGGEVRVVGKDIKLQALMKIIDHGHALVAVYGGDGKSSALMGISEKYGGMVGVTDNNGVSTALGP